MMMNTLPRTEILKSKIRIEDLMKQGESFANHPIRIVYLIHEAEDVPVKVMFSVSKRRFKHAVDRNRVKRLMREAYRLNKQELLSVVEKEQVGMSVMLMFTGKRLPDFHSTSAKIILSLQRLVSIVESTPDQS